ncbi:hypothetical protein [Desulfopila sp. IMCC35008]|uniref:hypothetical protein n=1 Tax=Desulfopila sp. IMCC35008 TaxID=2653858 RepID=UPI0013D026F5|nr:hypothetical protein [Desulfopila sp. IMCC35008]
MRRILFVPFTEDEAGDCTNASTYNSICDRAPSGDGTEYCVATSTIVSKSGFVISWVVAGPSLPSFSPYPASSMMIHLGSFYL